MAEHDEIPDNAALIAYIDALKCAYGSEQWKTLEGFARRAWDQCRLASDGSWDQVKDRIRAEWP